MTTRATPEHKAALTRTATLLREFLLDARCHRRHALDVTLQAFPAGACSAASTLLAWALRDQGEVAGLLTVEAFDADAGRPFSHAWVYAAPYHVDITGDQFTPEPQGTRRKATLPGVYVSCTPPPWTKGRTPEPAAEDAGADAPLRSEYDRFQTWVQAIPDLRFQPRRAVVDSWQGADVLECGHLRHNPHKSTYQPRKRPCHFCPAQAASRVYRATGNTAALDWFATLSDEVRGELITRLHSERPSAVD